MTTLWATRYRIVRVSSRSRRQRSARASVLSHNRRDVNTQTTMDVPKMQGLFTAQWKLVALAVSLIAWGISFWFGCRAVKRNEYGLQYNHAWHTEARSPTDRAALDSLMSIESRASASSSR